MIASFLGILQPDRQVLRRVDEDQSDCNDEVVNLPCTESLRPDGFLDLFIKVRFRVINFLIVNIDIIGWTTSGSYLNTFFVCILLPLLYS